ncbi:hypothetical protein BIFANG_02272 [Bifidobacterium angulatum DSM 20098 = JCM 7096]|uniref:Uncharacterized protein n=1 Tax=Bifidobacterium angulatum DSM 20098 = JCM 7096 TaxID=518635 RepID=C4FD89_9BIFI|nr:hypothetical protein BIFANG_02272 [Bifidobacterium angulatum DSM 20098 = JCM 7096]
MPYMRCCSHRRPLSLPWGCGIITATDMFQDKLFVFSFPPFVCLSVAQ